MQDLMEKLAKRIEADLFAAIAGPPQKRRQTALRARGNAFEVVEIDDEGNIIEPLKRCLRCGPVLLCAEHMALVA